MVITVFWAYGELHPHNKSSKILFAHKWGRKCMLTKWACHNGSPLQILFQFPNEEFPLTDCRGLWAKSYIKMRVKEEVGWFFPGKFLGK